MLVEPLGRHGKRATYQAKVGTMGSTVIIVKGKSPKSRHEFSLNERLLFQETHLLRGMSIGCTPAWTTGVIWKIEADRLFITRI